MSMDTETLAALRGSIEKWERIVADTDTDQGAANCPLCEMFFDSEYEEEDNAGQVYCRGCPVYVHTGKDNCDGTPYQGWVRAGGRFNMADTLQRIVAADAELDFLRSLLPEGEK